MGDELWSALGMTRSSRPATVPIRCWFPAKIRFPVQKPCLVSLTERLLAFAGLASHPFGVVRELRLPTLVILSTAFLDEIRPAQP
jgi:hypothetical protein